MHEDRYTSMGKEVLRDDRHFADTMSPDDAQALCLMLNAYRGNPLDFVTRTLFPEKVTADD